MSRNLHLRLGATFGRVNKLASNEQQSLRGTEWGSAQRVANGGGEEEEEDSLVWMLLRIRE